MPDVLQIPVANGTANLVWNGRPAPGINSLLLCNQDLNNTVYVGNQPGITALTSNTVPLAPNGTISVDPSSAWYVVGAAAGILPLVMVPNGQAYFLGITQGLGNLAIPSIQSPNFIHSISGWQIDKNGNAEFNSLTIRGTFFGLDFIINSQGAFFYNGTPALGNLKISIVSNGGGTDGFGNVYLDNITCYNVAVAGGGYAQIAANPVTGIPYVVLFPAGTTHTSAPPQATGGVVNPGAVNEQLQGVFESGFGTGPGNAGAASLQVVSRANDGSSPSIAALLGDLVKAKWLDGTQYSVGHTTVNIGPNTINSTTDQTLMAMTVVAASYRFRAMLRCVAAASGIAQALRVGFTGTSSVSGTRTFVKSYTETTGTSVNAGNINGLSNYYDTGSIPNGIVFDIEVEGFWTFSAGGSFNFVSHVATSAADETFAIQQFSFGRLEPA